MAAGLPWACIRAAGDPMSKPKHEEYFEMYFGLGPGRTLKKVAQRLVDDPETDCGSLTGTTRSLEGMSVQYHWQEQVRQRVDERSRAVDAELREELVELRREFVITARVDLARYIRQVRQATAAGKPVMIENAADLDRILRLAFSSTGQPIAERVEHTGPDGGPVELQHLDEWDDLTDEQLSELLKESDNGGQPRESDGEPVGDAADGDDSADQTQGTD